MKLHKHEVFLSSNHITVPVFCNNVWDVNVRDTHVLLQMFAAAMDGWLNGCMNVCMDLFSLYSFGWTASVPILSCAYPSLWEHVLTS
jgi:hypothetical protein